MGLGGISILMDLFFVKKYIILVCYSRNKLDQYRYGFQGQETDKEILGGAVSFKYRIHDARLGRFLSVDPLAPDYPHNSPYAFSENRVIDAVELEGRELRLVTGDGATLFKELGSTQIEVITDAQVESAQVWVYIYENNGGPGHSLIGNPATGEVWEINHPTDEQGDRVHGVLSENGKATGYKYDGFDSREIWEGRSVGLLSGEDVERGELQLSYVLVLDPDGATQYLDSWVGETDWPYAADFNCKDFCLQGLVAGGRPDFDNTEDAENDILPSGFPVEPTVIIDAQRDADGNFIPNGDNKIEIETTVIGGL